MLAVNNLYKATIRNENAVELPPIALQYYPPMLCGQKTYELEFLWYIPYVY